MKTRPGRPDNARPFLKWAGGKRQLLPQLRRFYPERFTKYHEPFLGGGAVFFDLTSQNRIHARGARLSDANADLIGCWQQLRDDPEDVIAQLQELGARRQRAPEEHYYEVRNRFNTTRDGGGHRAWKRPAEYTAELAAMLIYLNRTGFNGLFRVNANGRFNVPYGWHTKAPVFDEAHLRQTAERLRESESAIECKPYETIVESAKEGDFVYLDPPYAPVSSSAAFTAYTAERFHANDQQRLQEIAIELAKRGCHILLSNSATREVEKLYDGNAATKRAGIEAHRVAARRAINADIAGRGAVEEYVITNVAARAAEHPDEVRSRQERATGRVERQASPRSGSWGPRCGPRAT